MMKYILPFKIKNFTFSAGLLLLALPAAYAVDDPAAPQIDAKAYVLMDFNSGKVLAEGNPDLRLDPASLTKSCPAM